MADNTPVPFDVNLGADSKMGVRFPEFPHAMNSESYFEVFAKAVPVASMLDEMAKSLALPPQMQAFSRISAMPDQMNGGVMQWPGLPPEAIKRISRDHLLPQMIIGMRIDDVLRYSSLSSHNWKPGWRIVMRESGAAPTDHELSEIRDAERFLMTCNAETGWDARKRDKAQLVGFPRFLATAARESLTYDMMPIWTDMDLQGRVKAFKVLPATNIRLTPSGYQGDREVFAVGVDDTNKVMERFTRDNLFIHLRNPRADADVLGYGYCEIEMAVKVIQAFSNAFEMNSTTFTASSIPNGILNVEGMWTQRQLDVLSRIWQNLRKGITKSWALPVIPIPKDGKMSVLDLSTIKGNEAMHQDFQNMMAGIYCCIMRFPVNRIGYRMSGKGPDNNPDPAMSGAIIDDEDPGREPLLTGIETAVNEYLVWSRWPHLMMRFTGKNPKEDAREYEARSLAMTFAERRAAADLKELTTGAKKGNKDIAELMDMCPVDPALAGVYQQLVAAKMGGTEEGAGPEARIGSKKDPAQSRDHGHEAGVRRDSKAEAKAAQKGGPSPLYISRPVLNAEAIVKWYKDQGCTPVVDPADMHVTVLYSKTPVLWEQMGQAPANLTVLASEDRDTAPLGDKGAQVLHFQSDTLQDRHWALRGRGGSSDYPTYRPHVTVSYDGTGFENVKPWTGLIQFGPEWFAEIVDEWRPTMTKASAEP